MREASGLQSPPTLANVSPKMFVARFNFRRWRVRRRAQERGR